MSSKIVLTFHCLNLAIAKLLQILGLYSRISKNFLDHENNFFSQFVRTILVTKYHTLTSLLTFLGFF